MVHPEGAPLARLPVSLALSEAVEHFLIQALVAQLAVEAFDEAVLLRFTRGDMVLGDAGLVLPCEGGPSE